ncbi:putative holin-like toxin [Aquibacillus koreensis]|uniref:Holin-like toxin n=1 Tax=Aquibacillus koreensis TaxID=279446 RepID=A0A9X3WM95_9BACI|nr:putative holin-like toxin [Aquibacillus koreensis]MCT2537166.1 putative holin-like toxin [Aquibacillus koreensis]MDC3419851.1 putative holin-like toxin [Aquibacillus koreensis]
MTTFAALSLVARFCIALIATLTFVVTIVVFLNKRNSRSLPR